MKIITFYSDLENKDGTFSKRFRILNCSDKKFLPRDAEEITVIDSEDLPKDKYFREAWTLDKNAGKVVIDKEKAVIIKASNLLSELGLHEKKKKLETEKLQAKALKNSHKEN